MCACANLIVSTPLQVKLCYICREEEHFDAGQFTTYSSGIPVLNLTSRLPAPEGAPKEWTHPCKCTLVAHESCLLKWIQTSQGDASRAPNALKCPQCGAQYELESDRPMILRILGAGNKLLQRAGRFFVLLSAVGTVVVFGSGMFLWSWYKALLDHPTRRRLYLAYCIWCMGC